MKTMLHIAKPDHLPENHEAIEAVEQYCQEMGLGSFAEPMNQYVIMEEKDPRIRGLLEVLASHGFSLRPDGVPAYMSDADRRRYVSHERRFASDESDWEAAPYLLLQVLRNVSHDDIIRPESVSPLSIACHNGVPEWWRVLDFAHPKNAGERDCVISDHVKATLEAATIRRIKFRPLTVLDYYKKMNPPTLWELESDLVMPAIAPSVPMVDMRGNPISHDDPNVTWRAPKPTDGMWVYTCSAIESVGPFDIARTLEPWNGPNFTPPRISTPFLVSKKFYHICRDNKFNVSWVPVRIEED